MSEATGIRQRLAAILAADAVGYSRLMAQDDQGTVETLDAARSTFRDAIHANSGRVIDMAGDSVLAVFETAAGAVGAALDVQRVLESQAAKLPEDRCMRFRIGVHLGDLIEKPDGSIYGEGVNIASRLQALASPGGVTVSDAVRGSVRNRVRASFQDMGEQQVKNITDPVHAFRMHPEDRRAAARPTNVVLEGKRLELPAFVYSLSTFETQLDPLDGLELVSNLIPAACLVSAYDVHSYLSKRTRSFNRSIAALAKSRTVLFIDSGNYEATRKADHWAATNVDGWSPEKFWEVASSVPAEVVFAYDPPSPETTFSRAVDGIVKRYIRDLMNTGLDARALCPIVHVPKNLRAERGIAEGLVWETVKELRPTLVAIPERELGDGLSARMRAVRAIRRKLDQFEFYQPLHILGTGNPITIAALAACGADSFDGLEWCRTAANYETNSLMHFQQFDLLMQLFSGRMRNPEARALAEMETAAFAVRVASYNYDYFEGWTRTIQKWLKSGDAEDLLRIIPTVGTNLEAVLREATPK